MKNICKNCGPTSISIRKGRKECKNCENSKRRSKKNASSIGVKTFLQAAKCFAPSVSSTKFYTVVSDVHIPHHDKEAVTTVLEYVKDLRPHGIVYNGDILDFYEISRFNSGSLKKLENQRFKDTWDQGNAFLDNFMKAAGNRLEEQYWNDGNHEDRLARWIEHEGNGVFADDEAFSIPGRLKLKERGITYNPVSDKAYVKLGHLLITHGRFATKYSAAKHLDTYRHSILIGHTHSPQVFFGPGFLHPQVCYVSGHLADTKSVAMDYSSEPNAWVQGFATVAVKKSGNFSVQLHTLWDGQFEVGGTTYGE